MNTLPDSRVNLPDDELLGLFDRALRPLSSEYGDHYIDGNFWMWLKRWPLADTIARNSFAGELAQGLDNEVAALSRREPDLDCVRIRSPYNVLQLLWLALKPGLQSIVPSHPHFLGFQVAIDGALSNRDDRAPADDALTQVRAWRQAVADAQLRPVVAVAMPALPRQVLAESDSSESVPQETAGQGIEKMATGKAGPNQQVGIQASELPATQSDASANADVDAAAPVVGSPAALHPKRKGGRPRKKLSDEDKRLAAAWHASGCKSYKEFASTRGTNASDVEMAVERVRTHTRRQNSR